MSVEASRWATHYSELGVVFTCPDCKAVTGGNYYSSKYKWIDNCTVRVRCKVCGANVDVELTDWGEEPWDSDDD